jgi:two-component system chemotaxis response regulator CheB
MSVLLAAASPVTAIDKPLRVMVVDDAVVARRLAMRWIDAEPDMTVAACLRTGREAVDQVVEVDPDVVVLDVYMPDLDGIAALPQLLEKKPGLTVIMASMLTRRGAEVTLRALSLGAADYVAKPVTSDEAPTTAAYRRELIEKIRQLGRARTARRAAPSPALGQVAPLQPALAPQQSEPVAFTLRPFAVAMPRALLIGCSTGGPQALTALMGSIGPTIDRIPVLIAQHMPATFTAVLAEHLTRISGRPAREGEHGETVAAGRIYLAPGGRHMRVIRGAEGPLIDIGDDPPINFCKPAIDPLFASAARVWGAGSLALVLTGMGSDGAGGASAIAAAGGNVLAQDEATSAVWGMPRAAARTGACAAVLPLPEIAGRINRLAVGDRS